METRRALEELRVADREALGIAGDLEQNWTLLVQWMQDFAWRRNNRGRVRTAEWKEAEAALQIVEARVRGAAAPDRPVAAFSPGSPTPLPGRSWSIAGRHAARVHASLWHAHALRGWIRATFDAWLEAAGPSTDVEPLGVLGGSGDSGRFGEIQACRTAYDLRALGFAVVVVAFVGFAIYNVVGCASADPPSQAASAPTKAQARPLPPSHDGGGADASDAACEASSARYLELRAGLDRCERDSDCAEIWPGVCPHGPYYIHREADLAPTRAAATEVEARCVLPECEPPQELGIAHCTDGRCVSGRTPPVPQQDESCWDYQERYLEAEDSAHGETVPHVRGTTPHVVVVPAAEGELTLRIDYPRACTDCTLLVSEHNSGMARLMDTSAAKASETERNGKPRRTDTIVLPVAPGPYHLVATSPTPADFHLRASLSAPAGEPAVSRHGVAWQRMCEG
ncbi:MAG: hypothetical protein AAF721_38560 [Myxococcota bacterium]